MGVMVSISGYSSVARQEASEVIPNGNKRGCCIKTCEQVELPKNVRLLALC